MIGCTACKANGTEVCFHCEGGKPTKKKTTADMDYSNGVPDSPPGPAVGYDDIIPDEDLVAMMRAAAAADPPSAEIQIRRFLVEEAAKSVGKEIPDWATASEPPELSPLHGQILAKCLERGQGLAVYAAKKILNGPEPGKPELTGREMEWDRWGSTWFWRVWRKIVRDGEA